MSETTTPTQAASDISDITWEMISAAGIDLDLVSKQWTEDGGQEYILVDGDTMIAFGPARTEPGGSAASGWDIAAYEREDGDWSQVSQVVAASPAEALRIVAGKPVTR